MLRRTRFLTGEHNEDLGVTDLTWINANGSEMRQDKWKDENMKCFGMLMDGRAQVTGIRKRGQDVKLLMILNSFHDAVDFALPRTAGGVEWTLFVDSNAPEDKDSPLFEFGAHYRVPGRPLLLFLMQPDAAASAANSSANL